MERHSRNTREATLEVDSWGFFGTRPESEHIQSSGLEEMVVSPAKMGIEMVSINRKEDRHISRHCPEMRFFCRETNHGNRICAAASAHIFHVSR
jgi:hypothetical protein